MIILTNIPSPYRAFLFQKLSNYLLKEKSNLLILYSRMSEKGRNFDLLNAFHGYDYIIDKKGLYFNFFRKYHIYFNPFLIIFALKKSLQNKTLVLSASWWNFNNLSIIFFLKIIKNILRIKTGKLGYWVEESPKFNKENIFLYQFKKIIYEQVDFFFVPGSFAYEKVKRIVNNKKNIFILPNLVDTNKFKKLDSEKKIKESNLKLISILIVARLEDKRKGISEFIKSVSSSKCFRKNFKIDIVGVGPDKEKIQRIIKEKDFTKNINLIGCLNYEEIANLMRKSDVFCLPSFLDPSPLSLVEAAFSQLPLIASKYCGNNKELVIHKKNGYLIDPMNYQTSISAINWIYENRLILQDIGNLSRKIAEKNYEPEFVIKKLIYSMKSLNFID